MYCATSPDLDKPKMQGCYYLDSNCAPIPPSRYVAAALCKLYAVCTLCSYDAADMRRPSRRAVGLLQVLRGSTANDSAPHCCDISSVGQMPQGGAGCAAGGLAVAVERNRSGAAAC